MSKQLHPDINQIVVFILDDLKYALPLSTVLRVIHVVEMRPLPNAPEIIAGIINVKGEIIPVVDLRKRFKLESREAIAEDNLILTDTGKRHIALWVDSVSGIKEIANEQYVDTKAYIPYSQYIKGVAKIEDEIILIYDLEQCLNLKEEIELTEALDKKV